MFKMHLVFHRPGISLESLNLFKRQIGKMMLRFQVEIQRDTIRMSEKLAICLLHVSGNQLCHFGYY